MSDEKWKPIIGFEYEVSNRGRVRNLSYGHRRFWGHILSPGDNGKGYMFVYLSKGKKPHRFYVHHLVAAAFIGPCPRGLEVNHENGDKADNKPRNLQYVTRGENNLHAFHKLGRKALRGEQGGNSKLTTEEVVAIRKLLRHGWPHYQIAFAYNVSKTTISNIRTGLTWSHVGRKERKRVHA